MFSNAKDTLLNRQERERIVKEVIDEVLGLGPLELILKDPTVSDILINGPKNIYIEKGGQMEKSDVEFRDGKYLLQIIDRIVSKVGRRIDKTSPMVDARLENGSRVNAIIPFLAPGTPMILQILPRSSFACLLILLTISHGESYARAETLNVSLRHQQAVDDTQGDYRIESTSQIWQPTQTAVIVCDMWDSHHCYRAVLREQQMVPRMEGLLNNLRSRGVTIIHAPSSCVGAYADNPARQRVASIPKSESPAGINQWCRSIPSEEAVTYPLDQSDGGEDDTPEEHASWAATLKSKGLNPKAPWKKQHAGLTIDPEQDFISDRGDEVWSILKHRNIANVILVGVHTNMCVLGRPFGLRQLSKNGMNVVLMRDLTDSMYNPRSWPHVSHLEGNALIIAHIERHICPTMTSDQFIGGIPFKFTPIQSSR